MLADAAKHAFDALIVWKTDRVGRNKEEIALNKYHLKKNGVKIHYIAETIPDTPEGIILEAVIEGMAAYYSKQLSQNIRRGQRAGAAKAQSTGGRSLSSIRRLPPRCALSMNSTQRAGRWRRSSAN